MTVAITRDVAPRVRGFLASCMLEVAPGVYVSPRMSRAVRERVLTVMEEMLDGPTNPGLVMIWLDRNYPGWLGLAILGSPPRALHQHDGVFLARRDCPPTAGAAKASDGSLTSR